MQNACIAHGLLKIRVSNVCCFNTEHKERNYFIQQIKYGNEMGNWGILNKTDKKTKHSLLLTGNVNQPSKTEQ